MEEKISVIVPVYKVEDYLPKCVDSILGQTYRNLEIILIDDGSPDQCREICDCYAGKDSRVHVIHKKNEGVARARNDGLEYASGDYISFVDSDDWIAPNAYEMLYQGLKKYDADCAVGRCVTVIDKGGKKSKKQEKSKKQNGVFMQKKEKAQPVRCETADKAMEHVLLSGSAIWNRLFKREIFREIRFPLDRVNDDEVVALHAYAECKKIVFLNQDTYYYRIRQNSITTSRFSIRNVDCYYNSMENLAFIKERKPQLRECAEYKYVKAMLYCYVNLQRLRHDPQAEMLKKEIYKDIRRNRFMALKNRYVPLYLKLVMIVCAVLMIFLR